MIPKLNYLRTMKVILFSNFHFRALTISSVFYNSFSCSGPMMIFIVCLNYAT